MTSPPLAAHIVDAAALADELARCRVVPADRAAELAAAFPGGGTVAFAEFLVAQNVLTPFQASRALAGDARSLVLGPYRLTAFHHAGTLGPLYAAGKTGRGPAGPFAVRVLPLRSLWQAKQARQLARSLASLPAHPAVVRLADADSANGFHYLVWPLTPGELLADRVQSTGPLAPAEAAVLLAHLSAGLAACHARDVVHGLLTPRAVALAPDPGGVPRLLELGAGILFAQNLAAEESLFDTLTAAEAVAGVLDYAAPEWLADPTRPTPATDQYALGAVGHFALTGYPPVRNPDDPSAAPRPVADVNPAVPDDLAAAVDRLLRPDPTERFVGMDEARDVFAGLAGHPHPADPEPDALSAAVSRHTGDWSQASKQGAVSWGSASVVQLPPDRDGSDASIQFNLPDDAFPVGPAGPTLPPVGVVQAAPPRPTAEPRKPVLRTPRRAPEPASAAVVPAPVPRPAPVRLAAAAPELPRTDEANAELSAPPLLPAAPLLHGTGVKPALPPSPPAPAPTPAPAPAGGDRGSQSVLWKKVKRNVLFWKVPTDSVCVDVYGPAVVLRAAAPRITVFLYPPGAADSVATLARAFQHEAVLLGSATLPQPVARGVRLAVHLAAAHGSIAAPLKSCTWQGQPHRVSFDLAVPWEAPSGPSPGVVSIGRDDVRIGKAEFQFQVVDG